MIQLFSAIFRYSDESATVTNNKHYDEDEKELFLENCLATYSDDKAKFFPLDGLVCQNNYLPHRHTLSILKNTDGVSDYGK